MDQNRPSIDPKSLPKPRSSDETDASTKNPPPPDGGGHQRPVSDGQSGTATPHEAASYTTSAPKGYKGTIDVTVLTDGRDPVQLTTDARVPEDELW
jgi:hypothetical protein